MQIVQRLRHIADPTPCNPFVVRCADDDSPMRLVSEATFRGPFVRCYLSAFDALIDSAALCAASASLYQAVRVSNIPEDAPIDGDTQGMVIFHLGWRARNGRVLQRPDGRLSGIGWPQLPRPAGPGIEMEFRALLAMRALFESAGLYAWHEVNRLLAVRSQARLAEDALRALNSSDPDCDTDPRDYNQVAIFDPEACEWHFVPRSKMHHWAF